MHRIIVFILFYSSLCAKSQVVNTTLTVTGLPEFYMPLFDTIFVAGSFNDWNPANPDYALSNNGSNWSITLSGNSGDAFEYKFTRGSWNTVEGNTNGNFIPNRSASFSANLDINHTIEGFEDFPSPHTAVGNTHVVMSHFFIPQLQRSRRVWIYLPENYYTSSENYPVLYMQDGQNLFDQGTAFAGEWEIDEYLANGCENTIVVGIDNGGQYRIDEYSPWLNPLYGGGEGELYAQFVVETLKPFIDENFRTKAELEFTGIGGSSLGALIAAYTALQYPSVFENVLLFSPSFWFSDEIFNLAAQANNNQNQKFYLCAGTYESESMQEDMITFKAELLSAGVPEDQILRISHDDGQHSEWYWAREFESAFDWLYCQKTSSTSVLNSEIELTLSPNPAYHHLLVKASVPLRDLSIFDNNGKLLWQQLNCWCDTLPVPIDNFSSGTYLLSVITENNLLYNQSFIKP
jgi:predicted alpha/beta superfamily hydrolase